MLKFYLIMSLVLIYNITQLSAGNVKTVVIKYNEHKCNIWFALYTLYIKVFFELILKFYF